MKIALTPGGLQVSRLVYGVFRLQNHARELPRLIDICLDHGVTTFDHADIYGSYTCEDMFGSLITPSQRSRMELVTKCGIKLVSPARPQHRVKSYDTSAAHIEQSVHQSLKNLRTDAIDLLLLHRPNPLLDADVLAETVLSLQKAGKIKAFGVSNFLPAQFDLVQSRLALPLATNQIEAHPLRPAVFFDGTLDHAQQHRYRPMIWSPLAGGRIVDHTALTTLLDRLAAAYQCTPEALVIAWLQRHPAGLVPIIGTSNEQRLIKILQSGPLDMDDETWFEILQTAMGQEIP